jgi:hypothetical protein
VEAADDQCRHYDFASGLSASSNNILFLFYSPIFIFSKNDVALVQLYKELEIQLLGKSMLTDGANAQEICIPSTAAQRGEKFRRPGLANGLILAQGAGVRLLRKSILEFWPQPVIAPLLA